MSFALYVLGIAVVWQVAMWWEEKHSPAAVPAAAPKVWKFAKPLPA